MISAKPMAMVAMLAFAGAAVAQEGTAEQRIAELIEWLQDPAGEDEAVHLLTRLGKPAALTLQGEIEEGRVEAYVLRALGELGSDGTQAVNLLKDA